MLARQDETVVHVDRVAGDEGADDAAHTLGCPHVPNLDVLIPTARDDKVGVLRNELGAEDTIGVARETAGATLERFSKLAGLLIVDADLAVLAGRQERFAIRLVVRGQQLIGLIVDSMQLPARSRVEVEERAFCVGRDHHIFGNSRSLKGAPPTQLNGNVRQ